MIIIEIDELNYQAFQKLNIAAFSIASVGAMGDAGSIYIIDTEGQIYHANFSHGEKHILEKHIKVIIPVIENIQFGMFDSKSNNEEWISTYLGGGSHLLMVKSLYEGFCQKRDETNFDIPAKIFLHWPGLILGILGKDDDHLTMSEIWEITIKKMKDLC